MESENGKALPVGSGRVSVADLFTAGHERESANMLARALKYGYLDIFSIDYAGCKAKAQELSNDPDKRVQAAGTKLLVEMAKHDLKLIELASGGGKEVGVNVQVNVVQVVGDCFKDV